MISPQILNNSIIQIETLNRNDSWNTIHLEGTWIIEINKKKSSVIASIDWILNYRIVNQRNIDSLPFKEIERVSFRVNEILEWTWYQYLIIGSDFYHWIYWGSVLSHVHFLHTKLLTWLSAPEEKLVKQIQSKWAYITKQDMEFLEKMEQKRLEYKNEVEHQFKMDRNKHHQKHWELELF